MVTKHFSETEEKTVLFSRQRGIKRENVTQTLGLNSVENFQIDHLAFKLESSFIFKDRLSGLLQDSRKERLSLKGPCHEVIAVLGQFCTEVIT